MIKPHKYMDLKLSIFNISHIIIQKLKNKNLYSYDDLYKAICQEINEDGIMELFNLALTFLYSFNAIKYNKHSDNVELLKNENI
ncbi:ABC-three component system middle component 6 [Bacillus paralicheniformis]|uniref:ABC-three component system middle component 6 n=1 Tax=Bacillus paralicheniformis TaxID=1648923 RepID=UPI000BA528A9|nr:ABC-three component system middle component 6 [Bacillus paralicheniformis]PAC95366.1 hypothetical protein CHH86_19980 [Bacillus paralicheniformis]